MQSALVVAVLVRLQQLTAQVAVEQVDILLAGLGFPTQSQLVQAVLEHQLLA
jgi:UDP-N-acetyl-D-mannosaminuronic acid transferase (WecB/TagA/CpsF family)